MSSNKKKMGSTLFFINNFVTTSENGVNSIFHFCWFLKENGDSPFLQDSNLTKHF